MFKIILSNIRKQKSSVATLFLLIVTAAMLLNIGLTVNSSLDSFYSEKIDELNSAHISYFISTPDIDKLTEKVSTFDGIRALESENTLFASGVKTKSKNNDVSNTLIIMNADNDRSMSNLKIIEENSIKPTNAVVLPLFFRDNFGFISGDSIDMEINGTKYNYSIYGFCEDINFGSPMFGINKIYLFDESYTNLSKYIAMGGSNGKLLSIQMNDKNKTSAMSKYFTNVINNWETPIVTSSSDIDMTKQGTLSILSIMAMAIIGFSFIVVIVSLIVLGFAITTSVEDGIQSIGILKALGYKNSQIILSIFLEYVILAFIGSSIGIFISLFLLPSIGDILSSSAGLTWALSARPSSIACCFVIIITLTAIVSALSAGKTKKITPLIALRNGLHTHSFKRNYFPLSKSSLNVNIGITLKSLVSNIKQNIMIVLIVATFTFASVFSLTLYTNLVKDKTAYFNMIGYPLSNVLLRSNDKATNEEKSAIFDEISKMKEVAKIDTYDQFTISINDTNNIALFVSDDIDSVNKNTIIDGRYPQYDNEISISGVISKSTNKSIGDIIPLTIRGTTEEFLITGLTEQITEMGLVVDMTEGGYQRFDNNYTVSSILIDLNEDANTADFITTLNNKFSNSGNNILNIELTLNNQTASIASGITVIMIVILCIMILVICLILFLIIKIKIMREKTNLGLFKAIGYTKYQLMAQIVLSLSSVIAIGTIIGGILGSIYTNDVSAVLLSSLGISNCHFIINYPYLILLVIGITIISLVISSLVAFRIRKITPYNLLTD